MSDSWEQWGPIGDEQEGGSEPGTLVTG
jgi:hypothetical protein